MIDVREIKLNMRYPESRQEDITDAFTRGYIGAVEIGNKAIKKLEAENAKLKEHVRWLKKGDVLHVITDQELADQLKHEREMRASITALDDENAKLREFAEMFAKVADEVGCDHCPYCDPDLCDEETDPMKDGCRLYEELRELGIEVKS